jgi:glycerol-3-phosphate acyltransferase PlsY
MSTIFWLIAGYFAGALPNSYLIAKAFKGIDIREHGSGNPGATNVYRVVGPIPGGIAFLCDFLKGFLPTFAALAFLPESQLLIAVSVGIMAIIGHVFTVFLRFKGGKGVATAAGVFFALMPIPTALSLGTFALVLALSKYVSLGSIIAAALLPAYALMLKSNRALVIISTIIAVLIVIKHKSNIQKLLTGTENRITERKQ